MTAIIEGYAMLRCSQNITLHWQVVATDHDEDGLRTLHDQEKRLMVLHMDVTDAAEVDKVVTKV
jgi:NADP-dependent 3-hydroxy acid dehydrogenase YdfG